ncbi:hypothetical protein D3C80_1724550 [compost metagenome]
MQQIRFNLLENAAQAAFNKFQLRHQALIPGLLKKDLQRVIQHTAGSPEGKFERPCIPDLGLQVMRLVDDDQGRTFGD